MEQGKVSQYSSSDGYGVIEPDDGKAAIRVFADDVNEPVSLVRRNHVEYDVVYGGKGPEAADVHVV